MVSQEEVRKAVPFGRFIRHRDIAAKLGLDRDAKTAMSSRLRSLIRWGDIERDEKKGYRRLR